MQPEEPLQIGEIMMRPPLHPRRVPDDWFDQQQGDSDASPHSFVDAAAYTRPMYTLVGLGNLVDVSKLTTVGSQPNANVNAHL